MKKLIVLVFLLTLVSPAFSQAQTKAMGVFVGDDFHASNVRDEKAIEILKGTFLALGGNEWNVATQISVTADIDLWGAKKTSGHLTARSSVGGRFSLSVELPDHSTLWWVDGVQGHLKNSEGKDHDLGIVTAASHQYYFFTAHLIMQALENSQYSIENLTNRDEEQQSSYHIRIAQHDGSSSGGDLLGTVSIHDLFINPATNLPTRSVTAVYPTTQIDHAIYDVLVFSGYRTAGNFTLPSDIQEFLAGQLINHFTLDSVQ